MVAKTITHTQFLVVKRIAPIWMRRTRGKGHSIVLYKELPSIPTCAFPQPKGHFAYVLDVGLPLCLVCAIPLCHDLAIHRLLDYGVVVGEGLFVVLRLFLKLLLQRLQGARHHTSNSPHQLVVLRLALCLFTFHIRLALEHLVVRLLKKHSPHVSYSIFNLLLVSIALGIVLGYVLQFPIALSLSLVPQRLIDEDMGATKFP